MQGLGNLLRGACVLVANHAGYLDGIVLLAVQAGRGLAYFPEGAFVRMPGLAPFHMGRSLRRRARSDPRAAAVRQGNYFAGIGLSFASSAPSGPSRRRQRAAS